MVLMWNLLDDDRRALLTNIGLLLMRLSFGALMLFAHGVPKLGKLGADPIEFADPFGLGAAPSLVLAVGAEVGCSILLIIGLGTRVATVPLMITMLVAAFIIHGDDPFRKQEFALLYFFRYLRLLCTGPGAFSLDHVLRRRVSTRDE